MNLLKIVRRLIRKKEKNNPMDFYRELMKGKVYAMGGRCINGKDNLGVDNTIIDTTYTEVQDLLLIEE